jgi:hypothetical protein
MVYVPACMSPGEAYAIHPPTTRHTHVSQGIDVHTAQEVFRQQSEELVLHGSWHLEGALI